MVWYYKDGDQEYGPVSKADLHALIRSKAVDGKTLVRSVEMDHWRPLIDVARRKSEQPSSTPPPTPSDHASPDDMNTKDAANDDGIDELVMEGEPEASIESSQSNDMTTATVDKAAPTTVCSQCNRTFPQDQVILYNEQQICASCKPLFVQKLKEGAVMPKNMTYGGFWIRFAAKLIDGIILNIVLWAFMLPVSGLMVPAMSADAKGGQALSSGFFILMGVSFFIGLGLPIFYNTYFLGRWGATLGKMACGLKVVTPNGDKINYMRAFGRFFAEWVSMITLYIGYIIAGFDDEKRAMHDRISSTRVVKKR